jgi:RiboL-PSP-HEPN
MSFTRYRSPALIKFWISLKEVGVLVSLHKPGTITTRQTEINESLARSCILLLCSHIESFFEDSIVDILTFHEYNNTPMNNLPDRLKVVQTLRKPLTDSLSSDKKWKIIESISQSPFTDISNKCAQGTFDASLHLKGFASPSKVNISDLFKGIGVEDIWKSIENKVGTKRFEINFNNFVNRRNNITHGSAADKPTIENVRDYIKDLCAIVIVVNDIVTEYLSNDFNVENPWSIIAL